MLGIKEKFVQSLPELKKVWGVTNDLAAPRLVKVVVSAGVGKIKDKKRLELIADRLAKITGQKPAPRGAKKSIAGFKVRQGETVGFLITLRGKRMFGFLDKLLNVVIPRLRDFRGLEEKSVDPMGNLTIGLREHNVFPETAEEELKDIFGLAVTIVTTAKNRDEALTLFRTLGFPFRSAK